MDKLNCIMIFGCSKINKLAQSVDLFSPTKVLAEITNIEFALKPEINLAQAIQNIIDTLKKNDLIVVAVFVPGRSEGAYVDNTITVISDGKRWCTMNNVLKAYNFVK